MKKFLEKKEADKHGPKSLIILHLNRDGAILVDLSRSQKSVIINSILELPPLDESLTFSGEAIQEILVEHGINPGYISVVVHLEKIMTTRLLKYDKHLKVDIEAFVIEKMHASDNYLINNAEYQKIGKEELMLSTILDEEFCNRLNHTLLTAKCRPIGISSAMMSRFNLIEDLYNGKTDDEAYIYMGKYTTIIIAKHNNIIVESRLFPHGYGSIVKYFEGFLQVDHDIALELLVSNSVDLTPCLQTNAMQWLHQINISIDFMERTNEFSVKKINLYTHNVPEESVSSLLELSIKRDVTPWKLKHDLCQEYEIDENIPDSSIFAIAEGAGIILENLK